MSAELNNLISKYELFRNIPFTNPSIGEHLEQWTWHDKKNHTNQAHEILVRSGKEINILKLKLSTQKNFDDLLNRLMQIEQNFTRDIKYH